jgi:hypothetical protein
LVRDEDIDGFWLIVESLRTDNTFSRPDPGRRLSRPGVLGSGTRVVALTGFIEKGQQSGAMELAQMLGHGLWERLQWHTHESLQDLF